MVLFWRICDMKNFVKKAGVLFLTFCLLFLYGCGSSKEQGTGEIDTTGVEPLLETTALPEDGVITDKQMATIQGKEGEYKFTGETEEGIAYTWTYKASLIKNPQEQRLKVEVNNTHTEQVKEAASQAQFGLGISLESMHMAAPASLTLVLTEKWDADSVIFCKYQKEKALRITDAEISTEERQGEEVTALTFQVTETGDTYYLVGGNTKAGGQEDQENNSNTGDDTQGTDSRQADGSTQGETGNNSGNQQTAGGTTQEETTQEETAQNQQTESGTTQEEVHTCTISIECSTILNNWDDLDQSKAEFVPSDGWILYPSEVSYTPGETVFDVLKRVCRETDIHMSSRYTPMYGSYYIEGINQLYEFDCGQNSGWMYRVNGWYPNYGCSSYEISEGDNIEWKYTCDLGSDIGGGVY